MEQLDVGCHDGKREGTRREGELLGVYRFLFSRKCGNENEKCKDGYGCQHVARGRETAVGIIKHMIPPYAGIARIKY